MQQAAILGLYDPDRSSMVLESGKESDWKKFEAAVKALSLGDGSGLRFLRQEFDGDVAVAFLAPC